MSEWTLFTATAVITVKAYDLVEAKLEAKLLWLDGWLVTKIKSPRGKITVL